MAGVIGIRTYALHIIDRTLHDLEFEVAGVPSSRQFTAVPAASSTVLRPRLGRHPPLYCSVGFIGLSITAFGAILTGVGIALSRPIVIFAGMIVAVPVAVVSAFIGIMLQSRPLNVENIVSSGDEIQVKTRNGLLTLPWRLIDFETIAVREGACLVRGWQDGAEEGTILRLTQDAAKELLAPRTADLVEATKSLKAFLQIDGDVPI
jgi:hypothetical protein